MPWPKVRRADGFHCSYCNQVTDRDAASCPGCGKALAPVGPEPEHGDLSIPLPSAPELKPDQAGLSSAPTPKADSHLSALTPTYWAFLSRIGNHPLDTKMARAWDVHVGGIDRALAKLQAEGLIRDATTAEKLSAKYVVKELKAMIEGRGLPARGKKADMVQSLLACVPNAELARQLSDVSLYMLTDEGTAVLKDRDAQAERARIAMEDAAYQALVQGNLEEASDLIERYSREYAFSPWETGEPKGYPFSTRLMLNNRFRELQANPQQRRAFGAAAVLAKMLDMSPAERALAALGGEFNCPPLEQFLKAPSGYAAKFDPDSVEDRIDLYLHTKETELVGARDLARIKKQHFGKGVVVTASRGTDCSLCTEGKREYTWDEIDALPRVPRHWGCQCWYAAWLDNVSDE